MIDSTICAKVQQHHKAINKFCEANGHILVFTALFGSQNYNLNDENSDVDTKSMIIPNPKEYLYKNTESHYMINFTDGGHAEAYQCYNLLRQFKKGNINFLETLFSNYIAVESEWNWVIKQLDDKKDIIAKADLRNQMNVWFGYIVQMYERSYNKVTKEINYKALMNLARLVRSYYLYFIRDEDFAHSIYFPEKDPYRARLLQIKHGDFTEDPLVLRDDLYAEGQLYQSIVKSHYEKNPPKVIDIEEELKLINYNMFIHVMSNASNNKCDF